MDNVREGPIYACVCCHRIKYKNVVKVFDNLLKEDILIKSKKPSIIDDSIGFPPKELLIKNSDTDEQNFYICNYCERKLKQGKIPPVSHKNKLELFDMKQFEFLNLSEAETAIIAKTILFQMFYRLPKSLWTGVKNRLVNVPILETDIEETIKSLPRTPGQAGLVKVKLKRKKSMKNTHLEQYINVEKCKKALNLFVEQGNPLYANISIIEDYEDFVRDNDLEGYLMINPQDENLSEHEIEDSTHEVMDNDKVNDNEDEEDLDDDES